MPCRSYLTALALAACWTSSAAGAPDPAMRDLTLVQSEAVEAGEDTGGTLKVAASFDRESLAYAVGERVRIFVTANEDAFITVFNIGPTGNVVQLFPNKHQTANAVKAGQPVEVSGDKAKIVVSGPVGSEVIKVFATNKPAKLTPDGDMLPAGAFALVKGGMATFSRDLTVAAQDPDLRLATANRAICTVETTAQLGGACLAREPAAITQPGVTPPALAAAVPAPEIKEPAKPQPGLQTSAPAKPEPAAGPPAPNPAAPVVADTAPLPEKQPSAAAAAVIALPIGAADNPFDLQIASDKQEYGSTDRITVTVVSPQACYLNVFEVSSAGKTRVLFPNQNAKNNLVGDKEPIAVSFERLTASEASPAGVGQMIAVCSSDVTPLSAMEYDFSGMFTPVGSSDFLASQLQEAATRLPGDVAMASVTISFRN